MTDQTKPADQEDRQADLAPETHNDEQDDHRAQAQEIAEQAKKGVHAGPGGTESGKPASPGVDNVAGSETDLIDQMREMEEKGKIDNAAFEGEPDHDDNPSKYS